LREFYSKRMPAHLVPREIVLLAELPKSASGKVSKRRLTAAS
jgi:acyl-coenzyme A synthetase/AMP-(fatty) acid ligase